MPFSGKKTGCSTFKKIAIVNKLILRKIFHCFSVDGLVFIMAPAESLLLAGAALEPNFASLLNDGSDNKPMPKPEKDEPKPVPEKVFDFKSENQDSAHEPHR